MTEMIHCLVLAGGGGTRLWPLSREEVPKQFLRLGGGESLLQVTLRRLLPLCGPDNISVVGGERWDSQIAYQADELGLNAESLFIPEPVGRNTAPAIALGLAALMEQGVDEIKPVLVCPSDHVINDQGAFYEAVRIGLRAIQEGKLVTFGVVPTAPETGFGYVKLGESHGGWHAVDRFVEKPDLATARGYLDNGGFLWNGGIFLFRMGDMVKALKKHLPEVGGVMDAGFSAMLEDFEGLPPISIDYGVLEKCGDVAVVPLDAGWSDLGSWDAIYDQSPKDCYDNVLRGDVLHDDCHGCLIRGGERLVAASGIRDLLVVDTADALFIAPRGTSQGVRDISRRLKEENRRELWQAPESTRHWGRYRILYEGDGVKVKKIEVHPGRMLSLQYHYQRTEHWIVVKGTAKVTRGEEEFYLHEGESTFIPRKMLHRLANSGQTVLEIIEVQNGPYLGEDDIVRVSEMGSCGG